MSSPLDLSTGRPLLSDKWDRDFFPDTPDGMHFHLTQAAERYPFEMTYSHVSAEEVCKNYWTGVVRDWHKVMHAMDRDTQVRQRNN